MLLNYFQFQKLWAWELGVNFIVNKTNFTAYTKHSQYFEKSVEIGEFKLARPTVLPVSGSSVFQITKNSCFFMQRLVCGATELDGWQLGLHIPSTCVAFIHEVLAQSEK